MQRPPESFFIPYPSRDDKNIQSLVCSKAEYRECKSGPDPFKDERVSDKYFNSQVLFQRLLTSYGSIMLLFQQSAGKTGCFSCYHEYVTKNTPGEISKFYYVSGDLQGKEFEDQIAKTFGSDEDKELLSNDKIKRKTAMKRILKRKNIVKMTYEGMAKKIKSIENNDVLIHTFADACVMIDEFDEIKLSEAKDTEKIQRNRLDNYKSYWRLFRLCSTCVVILATGTPIRDDVSEFIYSANLLPNTKQISTVLSQRIAKEVCDEHNIDPKSLGLEEGGKNWLTGFDINDKNTKRREKQLESILRGRIMQIRAPVTGAVVKYLDDEEIERLKKFYKEEIKREANVYRDNDIDKYVTDVYMSKFQTLGYLHSLRSDESGLRTQPTQASIFVFPQKEYAKKVLNEEDADYMLKDLSFEDTYGGAGFNRCFEGGKNKASKKDENSKKSKKTQVSVKKKKKNSGDYMGYAPKEWFAEYLADDNLLRNSSAIISDIVYLSQLKDGFPVYVPSKFLESCLVVTMHALKLRGFNVYTGDEKIHDNGLPSKRNRVAIISPEQSNVFKEILRVWGHPANVTGEYIKTLLVSPAGATGLNIPNAGHCCITEPRSNSSKTRQAEYRILRPNSHIASLKYVKEKWGWDEFPVYVHYYIPQPYAYTEAATEMAGREISGSSDSSDSSDKSNETSEEESNVTSEEGSSAESNSASEESSVDNEEIFDNELAEFKKLVPRESKNGKLVFDTLLSNKYKGYVPSHWTLYSLSHDKDLEEASLMRSIRRIAVDAPLNVGRNVRKDIADGSFEADYQLAKYEPYNCDETLPVDYSTYETYYMGSKQLWTSKEFLSFVTSVGYLEANKITHSTYKSLAPQEIITALRRLVESRELVGLNYIGFPVVLQEDSGVFYTTSNHSHESSVKLIAHNSVDTFTSSATLNNEVFHRLDANAIKEYKRNLEKSESYKAYLLSIPNVYKCALLEEAINELSKEEYVRDEENWVARTVCTLINLFISVDEPGTENGMVVVHQVNNLYSGYGNNFVAVDKIVNVKNHLRIFNGISWYDCTDEENDYYSKYLSEVIESQLQDFYKRHEGLGFIGIIVRVDKIHIRTFAINNGKYVSKSKGQNVFSLPHKTLLDMLYKLDPEDENGSEKEKKRYINLMKKTKIGDKPLSDKTLSSFTAGKLKFFYENKDKQKHELSKTLCTKLNERDAIFAIVGDVDEVIKKTIKSSD